jgi:hypothetical protein
MISNATKRVRITGKSKGLAAIPQARDGVGFSPYHRKAEPTAKYSQLPWTTKQDQEKDFPTIEKSLRA